MVVKYLRKKDSKDYTREEKRTFNFLSLFGEYKVVGSGSYLGIEYSDDFDLMEYVNLSRDYFTYEKVRKLFLQKYKKAYQSDNMYITDFKCGTFRGQPVRWTYESMKKGHQFIDDIRITFGETLQQESRIKMDLIVYENDTFVEFSEIYFLSFGEFNTYDVGENVEKRLKVSIQRDIQKKYEKGDLFKSLKRLFSLLRLDLLDKSEEGHLLMRFFNSKTGKLAKIRGDLETIKTVNINNFKNPPLYQVINALDKTKELSPYNRLKDEITKVYQIAKHTQEFNEMDKREDINKNIDELIKLLSYKINQNSLDFVKQTKKIMLYYNI